MISALIRAMRNPKSKDGLGPVTDLTNTLYKLTGVHHGAFKVHADWSYSYAGLRDMSKADLVNAWEVWWRHVVEACTWNPLPLDEVTQRQVQAAIQHLGDADAKQVEAARESLIAMGEAILPLLSLAQRDTSQDIQQHIAVILAEFDNREHASSFAHKSGLDRDLRFLVHQLETADKKLAQQINARLALLTGHRFEKGDQQKWAAWLDEHLSALVWQEEQSNTPNGSKFPLPPDGHSTRGEGALFFVFVFLPDAIWT